MTTLDPFDAHEDESVEERSLRMMREYSGRVLPGAAFGGNGTAETMRLVARLRMDYPQILDSPTHFARKACLDPVWVSLLMKHALGSDEIPEEAVTRLKEAAASGW